MDNQEVKHKRRERYSGTHPRSYKENTRSIIPKNMPTPSNG